MERRANQIYAAEQIAAAIAAGERNICVTSPTGGGKTLMMIDQLSEFPSAAVYTDRRLLFKQLHENLISQGIEHGKRASGHEKRLLDDVQLCMIQSESSRAVKAGKAGAAVRWGKVKKQKTKNETARKDAEKLAKIREKG